MIYLRADHFKFIVLGVHEFGCLDRFLKIKFVKSSAIIFSNILLASLPSSEITHFTYVVDGVPAVSEVQLIFFVDVLFSLCFSDWIILINLSWSSLIIFSACSNLLLVPCSEFLKIQLLCFIISISLLIFFIW